MVASTKLSPQDNLSKIIYQQWYYKTGFQVKIRELSLAGQIGFWRFPVRKDLLTSLLTSAPADDVMAVW